MNLTHLRFFYDSARLGSVSEAARNNHVSQSAISQGIKKLELSLGMKLTHHLRQKFQLTDEGRLLLEEAREVFLSVDRMLDTVNRNKGKVKGLARFACPNSIALYLFPKVLKEAWKKLPDVSFEFHRGSRAFIRNSLREGSVDFALVLSGPEFEDYDKQVVAKGRFGLYCTPGHADNLGKGVFVDHAESPEYRQINQKDDFTIREELSGWTIVAAFISKGMGVGLIPDFMAEKGWKSIKCPKVSYEIWAVWPKGRQLMTPSSALIDLTEEIQNLT